MFIATASSELAISALTQAEVMVHPHRADILEEFERNIAGLQWDVQGIDARDARELAILRAETSLRMPDLVVLQLALKLGAGLATTDATLAREATHKGLEVCAPAVTPLVSTNR